MLAERSRFHGYPIGMPNIDLSKQPEDIAINKDIGGLGLQIMFYYGNKQ